MRIGRFVRATLIGAAVTTALVFSLSPALPRVARGPGQAPLMIHRIR